MPENTDPITLTLDTLRSDVERNPLADSLTVRRRGDRRTRHQAVAGAVVVVALVAGAVGLYGGTGGDTRRTAPPATQSPTAEPTFALATDPLLQPDEIGTAAGAPVWQVNPDPATANVQVHQCVAIPSSLGAEQTESRMYYDENEPAHVYEHVLRFADVASATQAGQSLLDALSACTSGGSDVVTRGPDQVSIAGADTAQRASRAGSQPGSEASYYELAVLRKGNVLIVLQCDSSVTADRTDWVWFPQRLKAALDRAVTR